MGTPDNITITREDLRALLPSLMISKSSEALDDIFDDLISLRKVINDSNVYDTEVLAKCKSVEQKVSLLALYFDSMRNLQKSLDNGAESE